MACTIYAPFENKVLSVPKVLIKGWVVWPDATFDLCRINHYVARIVSVLLLEKEISKSLPATKFSVYRGY